MWTFAGCGVFKATPPPEIFGKILHTPFSGLTNFLQTLFRCGYATFRRMYKNVSGFWEFSRKIFCFRG